LKKWHHLDLNLRTADLEIDTHNQSATAPHLLHFTKLFTFSPFRYHLIFHVLPSHFFSMEQMLKLMLIPLSLEHLKFILQSDIGKVIGKGQTWALFSGQQVYYASMVTLTTFIIPSQLAAYIIVFVCL